MLNVLILANIGLLALLCFGLGSVFQKRRSLDLKGFMYAQGLKDIREERQRLSEAAKVFREKLVSSTERNSVDWQERMASIARLSILAERLVMVHSGSQQRELVEKLSDLLQPIVGYAELTEKLLKKIFIGKDDRLVMLREWNREIFDRSMETRAFLGTVNIFNAPVKNRRAIMKT